MYGDNSEYDENELGQLFLTEAIRMAHPLTFNCLYAWKYELYDGKIVPLAQKGLLYNF